MIRGGNNWQLEYSEGVVIGTFEQGMEMDAFDTEALPAFEEILDRHRNDIVATADLVQIEDPFENDVFETWEAAARETAKLPNYERTALTADGIKAISLRERLSVPEAEFRTFDDHEQAIEWAKGNE